MSSENTREFTIEVPAKWVFSGEHSVLRGGSAIAFPLTKFSLKLNYRENQNLTVTANEPKSQMNLLLARASEFLGKDVSLFSKGEIEIQSSIPIGAGLGSSAALSVAVARLAIWKTGANSDQCIPLATHLEDVFHGKSSGMDVSVIAQAKPILFSMKNGAEVLTDFKRHPHFEFYDSGKRGQTKLCIDLVTTWRSGSLGLAKKFDDQMNLATEEALGALHRFEALPSDAELVLARAMTRAQVCFEAWGLVPDELLKQKNDLLKQGALAVKLTGAGLGGFWVALWPDRRPP